MTFNFLPRTIFVLTTGCAAAFAAGTLDFYLVDVGQANATVVVAPSGQSMLLDTGTRNTAGRVLAVLREAGVTQLDYIVASHYHQDHIGGVAEIAPKIKVGAFVDHGPSLESGKSEEWWQKLKGDQYRPEMGATYDAMFEEYAAIVGKGRHVVVEAGDKIPFGGVDVLAVCAAGKMMQRPLPGAGKANPACTGIETRLDDYEEDGQSIGLVFSFGKFRFAQLGDLTWNLANRFFCPNNPVGKVDVYVMTHHARSYPKEAGEMSWSLSSCPKAEVHGLQPRVALASVGTSAPVRRADAFQVTRTSPGLEDLWQTNKMRLGPEKEYNSSDPFIANIGERSDKPLYIKVSAKADGSFAVTNSRNGFTKQYAAR